jgi:hypothetical protein
MFMASYQLRKSVCVLVLASVALCAGTGHAEQPPRRAEVVRPQERSYFQIQAENPNARLLRWEPLPNGQGDWSDDDDPGWVDECALPCSKRLDPKQRYRIAGEGIVSSNAFRLNPMHRTLRADVGTKAGKVGGIVILSLGGATTVTGLSILMLSSFVRLVDSENSEAKQLQLIGGMVTLGGIGAIVGGILMIVGNRTKVNYDTSYSPARVGLGKGVWLSPQGIQFLRLAFHPNSQRYFK